MTGDLAALVERRRQMAREALVEVDAEIAQHEAARLTAQAAHDLDEEFRLDSALQKAARGPAGVRGARGMRGGGTNRQSSLKTIAEPMRSAETRKESELPNIVEVPLPATVSELLANRKVAPIRTLNDAIDDIVVAVWTEPNYQKLIEATYDEAAVEGSLAADNILAAQFIREYAVAHNIPKVVDQKLATISKAHGVVLRRYGATRKERRVTVHGVAVPSEMNGE